MGRIRQLPENPTLGDLRTAYAGLFDLLRPYGHALMRGPGPLTPGQRELIAAYTSALNSCRFCHGVHAEVAKGFGIDPDIFEGMMADPNGASVDDKMKPLLAYVGKLTQAPSRLTDADADAVYAVGWDDDALVYTIAVCAYFNNMNRLVEGAGIVGNKETYESQASVLIEQGYQRKSN